MNHKIIEFFGLPGVGKTTFEIEVKKYLKLKNKTVLISGNSGAGKSTLINKIIPELDLKIKNEGRDNIVSIWTEAMKGYPFVHMMAQPGYININGNNASMRSYTLETAVLPDGTEIHPCGQYDDELIREEGEWKFSHRSFKNLHGE
jgi:hypothetical protein